jgi:chromosome segregation protein
MRLERLEISGFKSFPERSDLAFDRGVTAIVGPNGCGKSNVVDAITWVLGEQSAKSLRGERMEDVIFTGSDARRPTAAAEVRLRLSGVATLAVRRAAERQSQDATRVLVIEDDPRAGQMELPASETRDVEIARRLYRSGESEYLLDGEVVRLRDIQDLLMDAGLGVRGYAVIEQGKIGQILGAKPTERRQLIEEAAGVTKYKARRRTAELKLDAAQQNLIRVEDIVFEIEKQRGQLKRQAAKARRYRRLREELRRWEKVLFARRYRVLGQAIDAARLRLAEARAGEAAAADRVAGVEQELGSLRDDLTRAEGDALSAREAAHAHQLEIERRQQQLVFDRQQIDALDQAVASLTADADALTARREPVRVELAERLDAATRAATDRDEAAAALLEQDRAHADALQGITVLETGVEAARARLTAGLTAVSTLRNAIERAVEARDRIAGELARLDAEAGDQQIEAEQLGAARRTAAEALQAARTAVERVTAVRSAREAALAAARLVHDERLRELRDREQDLAAARARLGSLEELDAAREGYGDAARAILHDGAAPIDHLGSVADYLETDGDHERAVEACLGELLQAVIVRRPEDAARGLDAVRERSLGRCGFLVVEGVPPAAPRTHEVPPGLRTLLSAVRVTGPHADRIREAVGGAWLAPSYDAGVAGAAQTDAPVATPSGDVFRGPSLVFGGVRGEARGILATKREIKELRQRLALDRSHTDRLGLDVAALDRSIAEHEQIATALVAELHEHEKSALEHELGVTRAAEALDRIARKLDVIATERRRAEEERRAHEARHDDARDAVLRLEGEQRDLQDAFASEQDQLAAARDSAARIGRLAADAKAVHAALGERAAALAHEVERLREAGEELEQRIAGRLAERERSLQRRADLERAVAEAEDRLGVDQQAHEALQEAVRAGDARVADLHTALVLREAAVREARAGLDEARALVGQVDLARVTAESDFAHLSAACDEALQATLEDVAVEVEALEQAGQATPDAAVIYADEEGDDDTDQPAAQGDDRTASAPDRPEDAAGLTARAVTAEEAIAALKTKIDRLGPVNMMAIEQFDDLEQRYTFLTTQRQDLVDSIAATGEAIKRIDRTTRERFHEAFTAINRYFEETFTTLFGGGRAGLVMLDQDDLLESGIDIIAQPPGKRLQNVHLLSGGEKALTAMGLLFAMFKYRPSPFCLLDEIDAPLDDANIGRFIEMLKGMLDLTQFIVVTHSRKTMEMADRLYGVTMEEPGVSKLISLRLN